MATLEVPSLAFDLRRAQAGLTAAGVERAHASVELAEANERLARRRMLAAEHLTTGEELSGAGFRTQLLETAVDAARGE